MLILGIDQSLAKCALVLMKDRKPIKNFVIKTGKSSAKTKRQKVHYYDTLQGQIHHICRVINNFIKSHEPLDKIVFESLSFGSAGNATRDLACLYGAIRESLILNGIDEDTLIEEVAPTSVKTFARELLDEQDKYEKDDKGKVVLLKSKKPKKIKMDKKLMVKAVRNEFGEDYLEGYNYSTGLDDLADATILSMIGEANEHK